MEGSPPPSDPLGSGALLGVTGDPGGNAGNVQAHRLSEFCHPEPRPRPPGGGGTSHGGLGCSTHCGSANGDPHLETFDGYDYDYQAAGEFTAVKSTTDDLEIQERQEPFASLNATVVTAVAMRVAGDRVEIDRGATLGVRLNGAQITPGTSARALPGGGTVARVGDEIVVVWPDGTQLRAWGVGPWGVAYLVDPAAARAGHLAGLLGRFDGDIRHLIGRDGHVYNAASLEGRRGFDGQVPPVRRELADHARRLAVRLRPRKDDNVVYRPARAAEDRDRRQPPGPRSDRRRADMPSERDPAAADPEGLRPRRRG